MAYDQDSDDRDFELFAHSDYIREAYGDPCPTHGILRGGGDCWMCEQMIEPEETEETEENPREKGDDDGVEYGDPRDEREDRWADDDIPF